MAPKLECLTCGSTEIISQEELDRRTDAWVKSERNPDPTICHNQVVRSSRIQDGQIVPEYETCGGVIDITE